MRRQAMVTVGSQTGGVRFRSEGCHRDLAPPDFAKSFTPLGESIDSVPMDAGPSK